jgi:hypothetical protein
VDFFLRKQAGKIQKSQTDQNNREKQCRISNSK